MNIEELYKESECCMGFSNEEILDYFVKPLKDKPNLMIKILTEDKENPDFENGKIEIVCLDGDKEELYISFMGCQTSIFIKNEEIMFIDEKAKSNYTISDTKYNVVYEGILRKLTHKEILMLFVDFINCFIGVNDMSIYEEVIDSSHTYQKCNYRIQIKKESAEKKIIRFENIYLDLES